MRKHLPVQSYFPRIEFYTVPYRHLKPDSLACEARCKKSFLWCCISCVLLFAFLHVTFISLSKPKQEEIKYDCFQGNAKKPLECAMEETFPWTKISEKKKQLKNAKKLDVLLEINGQKGIHIIGTQFSLKQGSCKYLVESRLELFQNICLPSMVNQDTQKFIWIIYGPHDMEKVLKQRMTDMVAKYPNIGVIFPEEREDPGGTLIWKARRHIIDNAESLAQIRLKEKNSLDFVITTMLDADDALHKSAIHRIQENANQQPLVLCYKNSLEWIPTKHMLGLLRKNRDECDYCYTAGLSLITKYEQIFEINVFWLSHTNLNDQIEEFFSCACSAKNPDCSCKCFRDITPIESSVPGILRSRTIAADGYANVIPELLNSKQTKWDISLPVAQSSFGLTETNFHNIYEYFQIYQEQIAHEASTCSNRLFSRLEFTKNVQKRLLKVLDKNGQNINKVAAEDSNFEKETQSWDKNLNMHNLFILLILCILIFNCFTIKFSRNL